MKKKQKEVQCFISSETIKRWGYPDRSNRNYSGYKIMYMSDIIVDHRGKLLKSRYSRLDKRFTTKDLRYFDGVVCKVPLKSVYL